MMQYNRSLSRVFWVILAVISLLAGNLPVMVGAEAADNDLETINPVVVDLRATGVSGDIFNAADCSILSGTVTEDSFEIETQSALGALVYYCQQNSLEITLQSSEYGIYVYQIGNEASDENTWMYYVNGSSPWDSAADYTLSDGDELHWVNYTLGLYSLSLTLDDDAYISGAGITATVTYTNGDGEGEAAEGAEVFISDATDDYGYPDTTAATSVGTTDANGELTFTWEDTGTFYPYAEWNSLNTVYNYPVVSLTISEPSPYAAEVIDSSGLGSGLYGDAEAVLGKPTTQIANTWGSAATARIKLVEPAYNVDLDGNKVITTINSGGYIIVKFDHKVLNDPDNPYGIDFLVFGNSFFSGSGSVSDATNMDEYIISDGTIYSEDVTVSVSQDGETWYEYTDGPFADGYFPTQAYQWNSTSHAWTDTEMDFTQPVNPDLTAADFSGLSAAEAIALYAGSGGGTGYNLDDVDGGLEWIQYIKVTSSGGEIDAFSDVAPETSEPISVDLRATGADGDIFNVSDYTIADDEVTEDGLTIDTQTAMGALVYYCQQNSIDITVQSTDYGYYVYQIGSKASDENSWMYYVNGSSPSDSAADYALADGDELHWVNYTLGLYSLSLTLDSDTCLIGDNITATVTYTGGDGDSVAAEGATIYVCNATDAYGYPDTTAATDAGETDSNGQLSFSWAESGTFYLYASYNGVNSLYQYPVVSFTATEASLSISPTTQTVAKGKSFTVTVNIDSDAITRGAQCDFSFDPALVEVTGVSVGTFYSNWASDNSAGTYWISPTIDNESGTLTNAAVSLTGGYPAGPIGSGSFMVITMKTLQSSGTSALTLSNVIIGDADAGTLSTGITSGTVTLKRASSGGGGGGSSGSSGSVATTPTVTVSNGTTKLNKTINSSGKFLTAVVAASEDQKASVSIPAGITGLTADGKALSYITATPLSADQSPSSGSFSLLGQVYDFGPDGATFDQPVAITISYDPAALPAGLEVSDLVISWYDAASGTWIALTTTVDTVSHTVSANVTHFTNFAVLAPVVVSPTETVTPLPATTTPTPAMVTPSAIVTATTPSASTPVATTAPAASAPVTTSATSGEATSKPFNWWILVLVAVVCLAAGLFIWKVKAGKNKNP